MNIEEAKEVKKLTSEFERLGKSLEQLTDEDIIHIGLRGEVTGRYMMGRNYTTIEVPESTISYACEDIVHRRNEIRDILSKIKY